MKTATESLKESAESLRKTIQKGMDDFSMHQEISNIKDYYQSIFCLLPECDFDKYLFLRRKEKEEIQQVKLKYESGTN